MARFFVAASNIFGGVAYLDREDAGHIRVLRMKQGELFTVCDGQGTDYNCRLTSCGTDGAEAEILSVTRSAGEPELFCTIYAAFPKGDKAELIIQKCVECGAAEIVFFPSERCVSRPDGASLIKKLDRWQKIAAEAAKQCGRGRIPGIRAAASFNEAIEAASKAAMPLFMYETGNDRLSFRDALSAEDGWTSAAIVTGPEGGFTAEEAELAKTRGLRIISLGPRILRCETAPIAALAALMYHTGNL